jgi:hypothetical protein
MPVISCRHAGTMPVFVRCLAMLFGLLIVASSGTALRAQTVEIKLLDGRNGRPMADTCIGVFVSTFDRMLGIQTDKNGITSLRLTENDAEVDTRNRPNGCGDWSVINPIVKYSEVITINAGYVLCQPHTPDHSWLATKEFSTKDVIQSGVVTANTCGKATASPTPGEIILFVRPLTWWEKFKS